MQLLTLAGIFPGLWSRNLRCGLLPSLRAETGWRFFRRFELCGGDMLMARFAMLLWSFRNESPFGGLL